VEKKHASEARGRRRDKRASSRQEGAVEAEGGAFKASHHSTSYYSILTRDREAIYVILLYIVPIPLFVPLV
jgi:hypothetical protein